MNDIDIQVDQLKAIIAMQKQLTDKYNNYLREIAEEIKCANELIEREDCESSSEVCMDAFDEIESYLINWGYLQEEEE